MAARAHSRTLLGGVRGVEQVRSLREVTSPHPARDSARLHFTLTFIYFERPALAEHARASRKLNIHLCRWGKLGFLLWAHRLDLHPQ